MTEAVPFDPSRYHADREIAITIADRLMREWIKSDRSPAIMGLTLVRLHALLLSGVPAQERGEGIRRYVEALGGMLAEIDRNGP